ALVQRGAHREVDGLRYADGHDDLAVHVVPDAAQLLGVLADRFAKRPDPVVRRVLGLAFLDGADGGLAEALGRDEVRLPDAERDRALDAGDEIEEAPDAAGRDARHL